jgi:lipoprotein-anchoring transpeptidase ErfK/SrfK
LATLFAKQCSGSLGLALVGLGLVAACSGSEIELVRPERPALARVSAALSARAAADGPSAETLAAPTERLPSRQPAPSPSVEVAAPSPSVEVDAPSRQTHASSSAAAAAETDSPEPPPFAPPELVATAREVIVYAEPERSARKLGYLRLGARVQRAAAPSGRDGCAQGWYRVAPEGYVCIGNAASLDQNHPLAELARTRARRDGPLPYVYGRSKPLPPPLYGHLPSKAETLALEGTPSHAASTFADLVSRSLPAELANGGPLPIPFGYARPASNETPRALANSAFALLDVVEHDGRRFGITTDLEFVPLDRLTRVEPSAFHGVALDETTTLPLVFVRSRRALLLSGSPERGFRPARPLAYREAISLGKRSVTSGGVRYLETRTGDWLADVELVHVAERPRPPAVKGERTWIHVSIADQTLVAYAGAAPVYATLVSTGRDGLGDPETTHSTPRGEFVIHTKHVTATMNGDEVGDEFDLRDVPYVEYFTQGFAFHAAYWHDAFGAPHSHGCVNLSPLDARWLFHFTEPSVPQGWHGAFARDGTYVSITP